jgi:outer membrane protein assembly factor BamB
VKRLIVFAFTLVLLSACGSEPVRVPNPLPEFKQKFALDTLWQAHVGTGVAEHFIKLVPVMVDDTLYAVEYSGNLYALNAKTGKRKWKVKLPIEISAGIGIGGDNLFVASPDGEVLAVALKTGKVVWKGLVSSEVLATPVYANNNLIIHTIDGKLFALDANSGRVRWSYDRSVPVLSLRGSSTPLVSQGTVFETFASGKLAILQLSDGKLLFERALGFATGRSDLERMIDADAGPLLDGNVLYAATYQGSVTALDLRSGNQLWNRKISVHQPMALEGNYLYLTDSDDTVWAYDKRNGIPVWKQDALFARQLTAPVVAGEYLLLGDFEGNLHILNRQNGEFVARYGEGITEIHNIKSKGRTGLKRTHPMRRLGILTPPLAKDNVVYIYARNGRLTALRLPDNES